MPAPNPDRSTWLAVYVGTLDNAFALSEEEVYGVTEIVRRLLTLLNVPDRATPRHLPMPVVHELVGAVYTTALAGRGTGVERDVRAATGLDCVASLEAWREALIGMLTTAYPDLSVQEKLLTTKVFTDLLASIGVPDRAASCHPQMVVDAYLEIDRAMG